MEEPRERQRLPYIVGLASATVVILSIAWLSGVVDYESQQVSRRFMAATMQAVFAAVGFLLMFCRHVYVIVVKKPDDVVATFVRPDGLWWWGAVAVFSSMMAISTLAHMLLSLAGV